jgi:hypothetical protein
MISMVRMLSRREWEAEEGCTILLISSNPSLVVEAPLEVCYVGSSHYNLFPVVNFHTWDSHSMLLCCEGGGSSRGRRQRRGEDVVHPLKVSLDELYNGTSKKLSLSRNVLCSKCNGYVKWLIFSVEPCIYFLLLQVLMLCCIH